MRAKDEAKIDAIFKSTIELTGEVGIAGLKMSNIAKNADLASGTLYLYFENKDKLLNELYVFLKEEALRKTLINSDDLSVKEKLGELWDKTIRYRIGHQAELVFMEQFLISPFVSEESRKASETYYLQILEILNRGKEEEQLKDLDNSILIPLLSGYVRDLSTSLTLHENIPIKKVIEQSFEVCWDAIAIRALNSEIN